MSKLLKFWRANGTKVLGYAQATLPALIAVPDLFPPSAKPYLLGVGILLGGLTVMRGYENSRMNGPPDDGSNSGA